MATDRPQVLRRDFLTGAAAGAALGAGGLMAGRAALGLGMAVFPENVNPSYAQCGEDVIVWEILKYLKVEKPSYLDVGAFLPIHSNNTYLAYTKGGRGVLVEPNVALTHELKAKRPGDTVLAVGVGITADQSADYYVTNLPQWNSFDKSEVDRRVRESNGELKVEKVVKVPLVPINTIIADHFGGQAPDYLSIDIEGLEAAVLKTLDLAKYRPKVICIDTLVTMSHKMRPDAVEFLTGHGYAVRGLTFPNTIFVDGKLLA